MYNDAEAVKDKVDMLQLINHDTRLKKVARTGGGEWAGPCPFCGGKDRFRVQPFHPDGGRYFCRGCGDNYWHDVIDYLMTRDHIGFQEALAQLTPIEIIMPIENEPIKSEEIVRSQWVQASYEFLERCIESLWGEEGEKARNYLYWRGLNDRSLERWLIGYNHADSYGIGEEWGIPGNGELFLPKGIVIPCQDAEGLHYLKIRRPKGKPKYHVLKGGNTWPYGLCTFLDTKYGFLFEGEFDVMLAYQTGFIGVGYASLPAGQPIKIDYQHFFHGIEDVIVAYDTDSEGQKAVDQMCKIQHFHKASPFPIGNDLTEYFQHTGSMEKVFAYLYEQLYLITVT